MSVRLVLTRPKASSRQVLAECEGALGVAVEAVLSPVLQIERSGAWPDLAGYQSVLLTSANAVWGPLDGKRVYCVGARTAAAAQAAGAEVMEMSLDAARLSAEITDTPLIYLRGEHVSVDLAARFQCDAHVVYEQRPAPLTPAAKHALAGEKPIILPLFSSRSARLAAKEVTQLGKKVQIIAMSPAVAEAWREAYCGQMPDLAVEICDEPTQIEMVGRIVASLRDATKGKFT